MRLIANDAKKCAKAAKLIYVSNTEKGIERIRKGKTFVYFFEGIKVTDPSVIDRINKLVIPPAWEQVWICKDENGHIQATGMDVRKRKQYRYHSQWNNLRNQTKFSKLLLFGEKLPILRLQLEKDLSKKELCLEKILATAISVMERTYIRIGNSEYEKANGSYGLTTLKDQHVKLQGNNIQFSFKGKKGISHKIKLSNPKLARIIKQSRDIPGKELFQYYDENGNPHPIDSGMVNRYIQEITGEEFTAKDFRTWAGTLNALDAFKKSGAGETATDTKKKINDALDYVSKKLGNTRTVCKKYYVHPLIIDLFEKQALTTYVKELDKIEKNDNLTGWTQNELLLLKILQSNS
ncbi:MAG TPA: DNA topoisomerase IB [Bacteroidia bacterium]|nr:DNA topoisomerase IB [Bacteroidia bacterium]